MATLPQPLDDTQAIPATSSKSPLLALPAELRNTIYEYLLIFSTPIHIYYRAYSEDEPRRVQFQRNHDAENPAKLFLSCKAINRDAASIYYSNNTFSFHSNNKYSVHHIRRGERRSLVEILAEFCSIIGSQTPLLRKIVLDINGIQHDDIYLPEYPCHECPVFNERSDLFHITPLLKVVWDLELNVHVRITGDDGYYRGCFYNTKAMTRVVRSILSGQLGLRQYGPQMTAVAVRYDGSGGAVNWASSEAYIRDPKLQLRPGPDSVDFTAANDGQQLCLEKPSRPRTLLSLPEEVFNTIAELVMRNDDMILDLNKDTSLTQGFAHVNKKLYRNWRYMFFCEQKHILLISTSNSRSTFSNFDKLRPVLRKVFQLDCCPSGEVSDCYLGYDNELVEIVIEFRLDHSISLAELQFSCLPLVMETAGFNDQDSLVVRSRALGSDKVVEEIRIQFQDLRLKVVKALMDVIFLAQNRCEPEIWINGLGEVVEVTSKPYQEYPQDDIPDTATELTLVEGTEKSSNYYTFPKLHRRDSVYRLCADHSQCKITDLDQFFPFSRSPSEALHYLTWILHRTSRNSKFYRYHRNRSLG
ncbi:hypothetical protein HBI43_106120 [Parastagonospora nodorum]|nr:hypothetical protein HBI43_106120 [Parastagonospora nodorum]